MILEYPFNNSPNASVSGEISRHNAVEFVRFKLAVSYRVPGSTSGEEGNHETI